MKPIALFAAIALAALNLSTTHVQTPPKVRMTRDVPVAITSPGKVPIRLGTLHCFDGFPDDSTFEKVYDNLDIERGVQAFLPAKCGCH